MWSVIKLFQLFECNENGPLSMTVIEQLQSWGLIAKPDTLKCNNNHFLILSESSDYVDGFVWRCRKSSLVSKKKVRCDFRQSIRKNTFFEKSHMSIWKLVLFSYLWTENVSQSFIKKEIDVAQQTVVDWASFHREVAFDGMILRHEKIGKYCCFHNLYMIHLFIIFLFTFIIMKAVKVKLLKSMSRSLVGGNITEGIEWRGSGFLVVWSGKQVNVS